MEKTFKWTLENGARANVLSIDATTNLSLVLAQVGLHLSRPVIVLVGGASNMKPSDLEDLRPLFANELIPLAESLQIAVVDGGTNAGVMHLAGQTYKDQGATFPLIGVLPAGKVYLPDMPAPSKTTDLEPHHTHFICVPGTEWGDESFWIAHIATVLSGEVPSVTVLINGGSVALDDVSESIQAGRPTLVISGSGRTADLLAEALQGRSTDYRAQVLAASGLLKVVDMKASAGTLFQMLRDILLMKDTQQ